MKKTYLLILMLLVCNQAHAVKVDDRDVASYIFKGYSVDANRKRPINIHYGSDTQIEKYETTIKYKFERLDADGKIIDSVVKSVKLVPTNAPEAEEVILAKVNSEEVLNELELEIEDKTGDVVKVAPDSVPDNQLKNIVENPTEEPAP